MKSKIRQITRQILPRNTRRWLVRQTRWPRVGRVNWHNLRNVEPISRSWGGDRGLPIDRYFIERFLGNNAECVKGRVLEIGDNVYTLRFGGKKVTASEIFNGAEGNPKATYAGDLTHAPQVPSDRFDCIICTQTLQLIPDLRAAVQTLHRILKPGGKLLVSVPGISQLYNDKEKCWLDYWRFTAFSANWLFQKYFPPENIYIESPGNVLLATAFLNGLAAEELRQEELEYNDPNYQLLILIRAIK
ncbi:MAG: class I SAM-dependent methyltransferase [Calditrichaceae bacterium]|nr:class I SAM-dependent methyltransferase [Calditrichia bacterium]NUQ40600.1 class I SAM-dependent methyltransferase [Calditrichaceae bacterium]